jgi:hypothetical protein
MTCKRVIIPAILACLPNCAAVPVWAQSGTVRRTEIRHVLLQAREAAKQAPASPSRDTLVTNLASSLASTGDLASALETVNELLEERERTWAYVPLGWVLTDAGNFPGAMQLALSVKDLERRDTILLHFSGALLDRKEFAAARQVANAMQEHSWTRRELLRRWAEALARDGQRSAASNLLRVAFQLVVESEERAPDENTRDLAGEYIQTAALQEKVGDAAGALESLARARRWMEQIAEANLEMHRSYAVQAFASAGKTMEALALMEELPAGESRDAALYFIANAQVAAGEVFAARETIARIQAAHWKSSGWRQMASTLAGRGETYSALDAARAIETPDERAYAMALVAWLAAGNQFHSLAVHALAAAQEEFKKVSRETENGNGGYSNYLNFVASTQAMLGDVPSGLDTARSITETHERADALGRVYHAWAENGAWRAAFAEAQHEADALERAEALLGVAQGMLH